MRAKSIKKVKEKIRALTIRSHSFSDDVIQEINSVVRGVANYFYAGGIASVRVQFQTLDAMIRRRFTRKTYAGKYRELTLSRQRRAGGESLPLTELITDVYRTDRGWEETQRVIMELIK